MKKPFRFISSLLAVLLVFQLFVGAAAPQASAQEQEQTYYLNLQLSDGISVDPSQRSDLFVKGRISGENFIFSENKTLTFTAVLGEGWSYHSSYSNFFPNDAQNAKVEALDDGELRFTYQANRGSAVPFEDLESIILNATAEKLPTLEITIEGDFSSVGKKEWVDAHFKLTEGTKQFIKGANYEGDGSVKGRGNNSWLKPQRPYSIKLSSKESLLDIPKTKKYAIVASYSDPSFMRNYITYKSSLRLQGIDYVPKIEFVDVYLNGSYNGVYSLVERIDIESNKIDIEEATDENITGGYIIEKDIGDKVDKNEDLWFNAPFQANENEDLFTLKAPDPVSQEMLDYLENHMQKLHDALMGESGEDYQTYIDLSSWADFLIVQELSKNVDGNLKTSCFMVKEKDSDVIRMDALWDFDLAYGLANWSNGCANNDWWDCPTGTDTSSFMVINSSCPWYQTLYQKPEFASLVKERYTAYRYGLIEDMQKLIDEQGAYLSLAAQKNQQRWPAMGSFSNAVSSLRSWLSGRISWLDNQWLQSDTATHMITLDAQGNGSVTPADGNLETVNRGVKTLTIVPQAGNRVEQILWNGIDITGMLSGNTLTTPIVTQDAQLKVVFSQATAQSYPVVIASLSHGTITADKTEANEGETVTLTVKPEDGYRLAANSLLVNDGAVEVTDHQFVMPAKAANITARFEEIPDKEQLTGLLGMLSKVDLTPYTAQTAAALTQALEAAAEIELAPNATQGEIQAAYRAMQNAFAALELREDTVVNPAGLRHSLDTVKKILRQPENYIPSTLEGLSQLAAEAESLLIQADATQQQIDQMIAQLAKAAAKVRVREGKEVLLRAMEEAAALEESDYTTASYAALVQALGEAQRVAEDVSATRQQIDEAAQSLQDAVHALVASIPEKEQPEDKPVSPEESTKPSEEDGKPEASQQPNQAQPSEEAADKTGQTDQAKPEQPKVSSVSGSELRKSEANASNPGTNPATGDVLPLAALLLLLAAGGAIIGLYAKRDRETE